MAELKCIYEKNHQKHYCSVWNEDLLLRLLNSLTDQQVQQQIEFVKDLGNIDNMLDEVVKYREVTVR